VGIDDILTSLGGQKGAAGGLSSILKLFGGQGGQGGQNGQSAQGLQGLVSGLTSNGMADQVKSWVGQGDNKPVTAAEVREHVDPAMLNQVAEQAHMTPEQVSENVAKVLPEMVNKATPEGQVPAQDPFAKGLGMLQGMFK
jgi:uncharacterized protein YidB (DUF937 family)